ncbi:hypothetical protein L596_007601 [Steinernema carpocapsae]|uniref:Battenin n=1 Tax=Steinernema carpocapsae TaxID=34508 RepID=A0A4U5PAF6_STECR|nr:hypothetical protein L596_007601 [Steinernema carpocapsae]
MKQRSGTIIRNLVAFWLFGLCNNYAYVIMLSAAEDIMDKQEGGGGDSSNGTDSYCEVGFGCSLTFIQNQGNISFNLFSHPTELYLLQGRNHLSTL